MPENIVVDLSQESCVGFILRCLYVLDINFDQR